MKTLKLDHDLAEKVRAGEKTSTWRLFDDKDISVNDHLNFIDKVNNDDETTWSAFGDYVVREVVEKRLADIEAADMDGHAPYENTDQMIAEFRGYYGDAVNEDTPVKIIYFQPAAEKVVQAEELVRIAEAQVYADGGSRGNPGPSAGGFALLDMENNVVKTSGKYLGVTTNNQAEYHALKGGVEAALSLGVRKLHVYMDSLLVINQMKGIYKIKNRDLWPIHQAIIEMLPKFEQVSFQHVPRELNRLADSIVNQTLDDNK